MSSRSFILSALLAQSCDSVSGKQNGDCATWPCVDSKETPMKKGSTTIQWQILFHWRRNVGVWVSKIDDNGAYTRNAIFSSVNAY
jgi:hypothetical protein